MTLIAAPNAVTEAMYVATAVAKMVPKVAKIVTVALVVSHGTVIRPDPSAAPSAMETVTGASPIVAEATRVAVSAADASAMVSAATRVAVSATDAGAGVAAATVLSMTAPRVSQLHTTNRNGCCVAAVPKSPRRGW
jgi:hypothetical protein